MRLAHVSIFDLRPAEVKAELRELVRLGGVNLKEEVRHAIH